MKALFFILLLLTLLVVLANQPWDLPTPSPATTQGWRGLLQDARVSPLTERVETLEKERLLLPDLTQKLADMAGRLHALSQQQEAIHRLESGTVVAKKTDSGWQLVELFSRLRQLRQRISFAQPFAHPPQVLLGITLLDLPGEKLRCHVRPEEIDPHGFTLVIETRSDTRIEEVQVNWLAFASGQGRQHVSPP